MFPRSQETVPSSHQAQRGPPVGLPWAEAGTAPGRWPLGGGARSVPAGLRGQVLRRLPLLCSAGFQSTCPSPGDSARVPPAWAVANVLGTELRPGTITPMAVSLSDSQLVFEPFFWGFVF